ncbi:MAG: LLM class flavin-dependent oxidoreductase [Thermodesulfobacteriota bacterium]|jgi:alkanesulfonate monooxygenase SsuD/methylene tetrahydromethanopterin reductase-like flavin-dependent oxidoreductase (luciferase family)
MKAGVFMMPSHPPERSFYDGHVWDLQHLELCDQLGFHEAWIGEHFTAPWEPNPAPDLLIAQALLRTKNIKLAPGAHLLPYHHPVELAHRVAYLDHMAQGRLMFGVGTSGLPSDWKLFNVDGTAGENRRMTQEALDIILKLWASEEPFEYKGRYWTVNRIGTMLDTLKFHLKPYQKPYPPIGIAGLTPRSDTLKIAGEHGFMPMSVALSNSYLKTHWQAVEDGAEKTGRVPSRRDWRVSREVYIAETDKEAREKAINGMLCRVYREYLMPLFKSFGMLSLFKHHPEVPDADVTPEYLVDHSWLVGSPRTVVQKLGDMYEETGGFGCLLVLTFDQSENQEGWANSQRLLMEEVMPHFANA